MPSRAFGTFVLALALGYGVGVGVARAADPDSSTVAAPADSAPPGFTPTVHITASRLDQPLPEYAGNVFLLEGEDLRRRPALHVGALLHDVPGFHVFDATGSQSRFVVSPRGFAGSGEAEYVELLVDGIPANELQKGLADFSLLPLSMLGRMEVLRGPASALYGDLATAGVVHLVSQARLAPWAASRGGSYGQFGLEAGGGVHGARGYAGGAASFIRADGWRDNSAWREARLFGRGALDFGAGRILGATVLASRADRDDPGPVPRAWLVSRPENAFFPHDSQESVRVLAGARLTGPLGPWMRHSSRVYVRTRDATVARSIAAALDAVEEGREELEERAGGLELETTARTPRVVVQIGVEAEGGRLDDTHLRGSGERVAAAVRRDKLAPWVQSVVDLPARFQVAAGARYDIFRLRFEQTAGGPARSRRRLERFSPRLALDWFRPEGSVYVSGSGLFKIPTLEQLYDLRHPFGLALSNPDLDAQHGTSVEIGARLHPDERTHAEAVVYRIRMRDEISFDAASFVYRNVGRSDHTGAEIAVRRAWTSRFASRVSYTWTGAVFRSGDVNGNRINGIPEHRGVCVVDVELPLAVGLALTVEANGAQQLDEANTRRLHGFALAGLRARRRFGVVDGFFQVDNLFDRRDAVSGYVLPLDGEELLHPAGARSLVLGFDLRR